MDIERMKQGYLNVPYFVCIMSIEKATKSILSTILFLNLIMSLSFCTDIRAARDKNGVYIPQERFVLDEVEKKVDGYFTILTFYTVLENI